MDVFLFEKKVGWMIDVCRVQLVWCAIKSFDGCERFAKIIIFNLLGFIYFGRIYTTVEMVRSDPV